MKMTGLNALVSRLRQNATIVILCTSVAVMMMGTGLVTPVLPQFARSFNVSITMVGLLVTAFGVARIAGDIPAGRLAERLGRRPVIIISPLVIAAGAFAAGLATNFWQLTIFRLVQGFGSALFTTAAMIITADLSTHDNRARLMGYYLGSVLIGTGLGPTFGGFIAQFFGLRAPFFAFALLSAAASVWAYFQLKETRLVVSSEKVLATGPAVAEQADPPASVHSRHSNPSLGATQLLRNPNFILIAAITFSVFFTRTGALYQMVPLLASERLGANASRIGLALTVAGIVNLLTLQVSGRLSDHFGRKIVLVPGCLTMAAFVGLLAITYDYQLLLIACVLDGLGIGMSSGPASAYMTDIVPREQYAKSISVYRTIGDAGMVIGPIILGWFTDLRGFTFALLLWTGGLVLMAIVFQLFAVEPPRRKSV
ncbi:MAG: MFS transporter [Chloroflexi bacterium]|nr:MFS transporter [Chloroflexota bacterium]